MLKEALKHFGMPLGLFAMDLGISLHALRKYIRRGMPADIAEKAACLIMELSNEEVIGRHEAKHFN